MDTAMRDQNSYTLGTMGGHNIVIAVLPGSGTNSAATVAIQLLNDFPSIRFGLLVGIGGGVPAKRRMAMIFDWEMWWSASQLPASVELSSMIWASIRQVAASNEPECWLNLLYSYGRVWKRWRLTIE